MERLSIDAYFLTIAIAASLRSTCNRRAVGAVLVKERRVISTGYNGAPPGLEHCGEKHVMFDGHCINTIHGEQNALIAARDQGDHLYCTDQPCIMCFKLALAHNPDIIVVYLRKYPDLARDHFIERHGLQDQCIPADLTTRREIERYMRVNL